MYETLKAALGFEAKNFFEGKVPLLRCSWAENYDLSGSYRKISYGDIFLALFP